MVGPSSTNGPYIMRTTDDGETWSAVLSSSVETVSGSILWAAYNPRTDVWLATAESGGVIKSADGGTTWSDKSPSSTANLNHITTDGFNWVAVGDNREIWISEDDGETWAGGANLVVDENMGADIAWRYICHNKFYPL